MNTIDALLAIRKDGFKGTITATIILLYALENEDVTSSDIIASTGIDKSTLSHAIQRLNKYIYLQPLYQNDKTKYIHLTHYGKKLRSNLGLK